MSLRDDNPSQKEGFLYALLERSREWTAGIWFVMMLGFVAVCGIIAFTVMFTLTLFFGM